MYESDSPFGQLNFAHDNLALKLAVMEGEGQVEGLLAVTESPKGEGGTHRAAPSRKRFGTSRSGKSSRASG